jgi:tetratricopeptide (TPR) repeat protein
MELALADFDAAARADPNDVLILLNRAATAVGLAQIGPPGDIAAYLARAIDDATTVLRHGENADALANRGIAHALREEWARAIQDLERALALKPSLKPRLQPILDGVRARTKP